MTDLRPVWIGVDTLDAITDALPNLALGDDLRAQWDAAPTDSPEALTAAICEKCYPQCTPAEIGDAAAAVLLAIGFPLPPPAASAPIGEPSPPSGT